MSIRAPRFTYRIAHLVVTSDRPAPYLDEAAGPDEILIEWSGGVPPSGDAIRSAGDGSATWLRIEGVSDGLAFVFPEFGTFVSDGRGRLITCYPQPSAELRSLWHLLLDQVLPLCLAARGELVLHASAVAVGPDRGALLFLGDSGSGKSSTAAGCVAAGAHVLSDDFARIELDTPEPAVYPAGVGLRLWPDTAAAAVENLPTVPVAQYTSKVRVLPPHPRPDGRSDPLPIRGLAFLDGRSRELTAPEVRPLGPASAVVRLMSGVFQIDPGDPDSRRRVLDQVSSLVDRVPAFALRMPEDLASIATASAHAMELLYMAAAAPAVPRRGAVAGV